MEILINWWAVIVTTIVSVALGTVWYGPLFGKAWMSIIGISAPEIITPDIRKMMMRSYAIVIVSSLVMNYVLLLSIIFASAYLDITGAAVGISIALCHWFGFIAPVTIGSVIWETRPWKYWFITSGYYLVLLLINGVILAVWM